MTASMSWPSTMMAWALHKKKRRRDMREKGRGGRREEEGEGKRRETGRGGRGEEEGEGKKRERG